MRYLSSKRFGEHPKLRVVERNRAGNCKSRLGERTNYLKAVPEICDYSPELGIFGDIPGLEKLGQELQYGDECENSRGN